MSRAPLTFPLTAALCGLLFACDGDDAIRPAADAGPDAGNDAGAQGGSCQQLGAAVGWQQGEPSTWTAEASAADIVASGEQTWPLALDLLAAVDEATAPSIAHSPTSMFASMGLSYARFQHVPCGERILSVMRYPQTGDELHQTLGAGLRALESRALAEDEGNPALVLSLRQSTWAFEGALPAPRPLDALYGTQHNALDTQGPEARALINCVIEEQSNGLLKDFVPQGRPAGDTTAYDINVAFLTAPWAAEMSAVGTIEFTGDAGATVELPRIVGDVQGQRFSGETFSALDVSLRGGQLSILFVRPNDDFAGGLSAFTQSLTVQQLRDARDNGVFSFTTFSMPTVSIPSTTLDYNSGATSLGFDCEAYTLRDVLHGATVEIDEKGIKAAAATVAEEWGDSGPDTPDMFFTLDRPFLFFVRDRSTHYVLYSGRYMGD